MQLEEFKSTMFDKIRGLHRELDFETTITNLKWAGINISSEAKKTKTGLDAKNLYIDHLEAIIEAITFISLVNDTVATIDYCEQDEKPKGGVS